MNELENPQTRYAWLKPLLISIFGTAIGVGLTFLANNAVGKKHQQAAQRETAIMAVCDIDEIAQGLKEEILLEDSLFKVAMYVWSHQETIDSFPMDTLIMAFEYLYDDPMTVKSWTADTKENAFNSGIDARMNIGNNQFYDNVQSCYYMRRSLIKVMAESPMFRRPISNDNYEEFLQKLDPNDIDQSGNPSPDAMRKAMKRFMSQGATALYIKRYFARRDAYMRFANRLERLNSENRLLMNISDEDIEAYIKRNSNNISDQAPAELLLGTWEMRLNNYENTYVFHQNNECEFTNMTSCQLQFQLKEEQKEVFVLCPMTIYMTGQWELTDDTLTIDLNTKNAEILSFDVDLSSLPQSAIDRMDSLDIKTEMMKDYFLEMIRQQSHKDVNVISFDKSGNSMMWIMEGNSAGNNEKTSFLLYRKL